MKFISLVMACVAFSTLTGCTDPDHYPISGQECSPDDPVQDLDAHDCVPPV